MRSGVLSALSAGLLLLGLITVEGRQAGVPGIDQAAVGGRSPRNANYDIDVRLDHAARTLTGRETIRWRNISSHPTSELQFHLYWNAWRNLESTWLRERRLAGNFTPPRDEAWSSIDITRLRLRKAAETSTEASTATSTATGATAGDWSS